MRSSPVRDAGSGEDAVKTESVSRPPAQLPSRRPAMFGDKERHRRRTSSIIGGLILALIVIGIVSALARPLPVGAAVDTAPGHAGEAHLHPSLHGRGLARRRPRRHRHRAARQRQLRQRHKLRLGSGRDRRHHRRQLRSRMSEASGSQASGLPSELVAPARVLASAWRDIVSSPPGTRPRSPHRTHHPTPGEAHSDDRRSEH